MKIGKQGEIIFEPRETYLGMKVNSFESNISELAEKPFTGVVKVQPHLLPVWRVLSGKEEFTRIRSGRDVVKLKYKPEKQGVRLSFYRFKDGEDEKKYEMASSFMVRGMKLNRLKQEFLESVKNMKILTITEDNFHFIKTPSVIVLRNGIKETYLTEDEVEKLKEIILQNYILSEPISFRGRNYTINEEGQIVYRGVIIPKTVIKDLYVLI